jgi:hypothetical protein
MHSLHHMPASADAFNTRRATGSTDSRDRNGRRSAFRRRVLANLLQPGRDRAVAAAAT